MSIPLYTFSDKYLKKDLFIRSFGNYSFHVSYDYETRSFEVVYFERSIPSRFMKRTDKSKSLQFKTITMDIETILNNDNTTIPYCIALFDGDVDHISYLSDFENNPDQLVLSVFDKVVR